MAVLSACVACGGTLGGRAAGSAVIDLRACERCGSWIQWPRPTAAELRAHHDAEAYYEIPYLELRRAALDASDLRWRTLRALLDGVGATPPRRVLDVGCDTGNLLDSARRLDGCEVVGIEIATRAAADATARGIPVHVGALETAPADVTDMDLITMIDVLEHVDDPGALLTDAARRAAPGGHVYVETPNPRSSVYRLGAILSRVPRVRRLAALSRLFPVEHAQYLTSEGMRRLADRAGLEVALLTSRRIPPTELATGAIVRGAINLVEQVQRPWPDRALLLVAVLRKPA